MWSKSILMCHLAWDSGSTTFPSVHLLFNHQQLLEMTQKAAAFSRQWIRVAQDAAGGGYNYTRPDAIVDTFIA